MNFTKDYLIASIGGDKKAFSMLYEEIYPDLYKMAIYMCGNSFVSEDLVSETILDAYKGISKLKSPESFESWILKILSTKAKQNFKKKYNSFGVDNPNAVDISTMDIGKDDTSSGLILRSDLFHALSILKPIDRMIISLCIIEGYKSHEAAEILSMNAATIRSRLNRSLKKLKKELEGNDYE